MIEAIKVDEDPEPGPEPRPRQIEIITAVQAEVEGGRSELPADDIRQDVDRYHMVDMARAEVHEATRAYEIAELLNSIDFSLENVDYSSRSTGSHNINDPRLNGNPSSHKIGTARNLRPSYYQGDANKWGRPIDEADETKKVIEQVGISKSSDKTWLTRTVQVMRPGVLGKLGFKKDSQESYSKAVDPTYQFDYEFAAPGAARITLVNTTKSAEAGNFAGQNIQLSVSLSRVQAEALSKILADDPLVARKVVDKFMEVRGESEKWHTELFDEDGKFHSPVRQPGAKFHARDVRPRYAAVPDLKPRIVGLLNDESV